MTPDSAAHGLSRRALVAAAAAVSAVVPLVGCDRRLPSAIGDGAWLGASAERGHLLRSPAGKAASVPGVQRRTGVLVVGAGIAGLAAARALIAAGIDDVRVLDLEDTAGGNSRGHRLGGMACPLGAHYLPVPGPQAVEVAALLDELGLRRTVAGRPVYDERTLCHTPRERLHIAGAWHDGLLPPVEALARAEQVATLAGYRRFSAAVAAVGRDGAFAMPTARARWTPALSALDAVTFDAWLDREGHTATALRWYLDYCCRDDYGAGSARVSAWAGLHYHASRHGFAAPGADTDDASEGLLTWPEGNAWLAARLAAPLGDRVQTGRIAMRVREQRHGVEVDVRDVASGRGERWTASQVVLAVPLFVAARLVESPSPALLAAAGLVSYAPWVVGNLWLDRALDDHPGAPPSWDNVVYEPTAAAATRAPGLPASPTLGYVDAMHQSLRPDAGATVLTSYWALGSTSAADATASRAALQSQPRSAWATAVVADLARVHPDLPDKLRRVDLARYGHAMAIPAPGVRSSAALAAASDTDRRIVHAHADLSAYSVFEEALYHGTRAGRAVARRLAGRPDAPSRRDTPAG